MQKPCGNCTSYHLGSGWTSYSFEIMKLFLVKKVVWRSRATHCHVQNVLQFHWRQYCLEGLGWPKYEEHFQDCLISVQCWHRSYIMKYESTWINYQYLLCQQAAILPFRTLFAANPRQFSLVLVEGKWISLDFIRLVSMSFYVTKSSPKNKLANRSVVQRWVTVQTVPGCELMHWVGWMNAIRYSLCGYIYIYT